MRAPIGLPLSSPRGFPALGWRLPLDAQVCRNLTNPQEQTLGRRKDAPPYCPKDKALRRLARDRGTCLADNVRNAHGGDEPGAPAKASPAASQWSAKSLLSDALAGFTSAIILAGNIVAFSALMFPGDMSAGVPVALWAMLAGSFVCGVLIALRTTIPPLATGIDTPTGAVLVVLSSGVTAAVIAAGGSSALAVQTAMLALALVSLVSGVALLLLGWTRLGYLFRFVPYSVVGGFLAATGWFLVIGGLQMIAGGSFSFLNSASALTVENVCKLAAAVLTLVAIIKARSIINSPFAVPVILIVFWIGGAAILRALGLNEADHGWYIGSRTEMESWSPFAAIADPATPWRVLIQSLPEVFAAATVAVLSLVTKVASIETTRSTAADLDCEFRAHGLGGLISAPLGGIAGAAQVGTSKLLKDAGGATRLSGAFAAIVLLGILVTNINIVGFVPLPIVVGLSFFLAYGFIGDALRRPLKMKAWLDVALIAAIAFVCARFGYMIGVAAGFLCACLLFAIAYGRVDVVKRRLSRATFASNVDRPRSHAQILRERGEAIQIYWLNGFIFFGSSDRVYQRISRDVEEAAKPVRFIVLDFSSVTGADSSAVMSLLKLRNFAERANVRLIYSGLTPAGADLLSREGLVGGASPHRMFATCDIALDWCEQIILDEAREAGGQDQEFRAWLLEQINPPVHAERLMSYFDRVEIPAGQALYKQGDLANTVDFVASGSLLIELVGADGERQRLRRIATHSIVGEMGFFRGLTRSAAVTAEEQAVVYSLARESFERMRRESPELAEAFCEFVIQVLADRVDFANRAISALAR